MLEFIRRNSLGVGGKPVDTSPVDPPADARSGLIYGITGISVVEDRWGFSKYVITHSILDPTVRISVAKLIYNHRIWWRVKIDSEERGAWRRVNARQLARYVKKVRNNIVNELSYNALGDIVAWPAQRMAYREFFVEDEPSYDVTKGKEGRT